MLTFGSLFAGIGGMDLGLERAGMKCEWQVEIDSYCRKVLAKHWPDVERFEDVREVGKHNLRAVDLVCGGFPCQPVSVAGQRKGTEDERWLWPEFARVVRELRPRWVLGENVPGLLSIDDGRTFGAVLRDLAESGYVVEWDCIPAAAVGAPHLRYRVFIVAHANSPGSVFDGFRLDGNGAPEAEKRKRVSGFESRPEGAGLADATSIGPRPGRAGRAATPSEGRDTEGEALANCDKKRLEGTEFQRGRVGVLQWLGDGGCWPTEPDVGRVADGVPIELDGGLDAHEICKMQAGTAGVPKTNRLRTLREYLATPAASSRPKLCAYCGHPMSALPCEGACSPWYVGARREENQDLRCLREGILFLLACQGEDVQPYLSERTWKAERPQAVGSRVSRIKGLGNAVVPQVAEWIGRRIIEADETK